jgi:hypothetical protein
VQRRCRMPRPAGRGRTGILSGRGHLRPEPFCPFLSQCEDSWRYIDSDNLARRDALREVDRDRPRSASNVEDRAARLEVRDEKVGAVGNGPNFVLLDHRLLLAGNLLVSHLRGQG